jgi:hypothetical protein
MKLFYIVYKNVDCVIVLHFKAREEPSSDIIVDYLERELDDEFALHEDIGGEYEVFGPVDINKLDEL